MKASRYALNLILLTAGLAACGLGLIGCSQSSVSSKDTASTEIRGEPINSPKPAPLVVEVSTPANTAASQTANSEPAKPAAASPVPDVRASLGKAKPAAPGEDEYLAVSFEKLASFKFEIPDDQPGTNQVVNSKSEEQIPKEIKALDQRKVSLKGFMLPLKVEGGLVTEMLITRDQSMCCYGTVPKINEWVSIKMTSKGVKAVMDQPVTVLGKIRVGEMRENGYLVGIYAMEGERMMAPQDL